MKLFNCACGSIVFFESKICVSSRSCASSTMGSSRRAPRRRPDGARRGAAIRADEPQTRDQERVSLRSGGSGGAGRICPHGAAIGRDPPTEMEIRHDRSSRLRPPFRSRNESPFSPGASSVTRCSSRASWTRSRSSATLRSRRRRSIRASPVPLGLALAVNLGLLSVFAVQHSGMARPAFKRVWTKIVPEPAERPTYVLLTTLALVVLFAFWHPIGGAVWTVTNPFVSFALRALYFAAGDAPVRDRADRSLRSVRAAPGVARVPRPTLRARAFATPGLYGHVRHPIYVSWAIIFWSTPTMSAGHLLFASVATAYMIVAVFFEEHDLVANFGDAYRRYQEADSEVSPAPRTAAGAPRGLRGVTARGAYSSRNSRIARIIADAERSSTIGQWLSPASGTKRAPEISDAAALADRTARSRRRGDARSGGNRHLSCIVATVRLHPRR